MRPTLVKMAVATGIKPIQGVRLDQHDELNTIDHAVDAEAHRRG